MALSEVEDPELVERVEGQKSKNPAEGLGFFVMGRHGEGVRGRKNSKSRTKTHLCHADKTTAGRP